MTKKEKLTLALTHLDNMTKLVEGNLWEGFLSSHIIPIKFEIIRQLELENVDE